MTKYSNDLIRNKAVNILRKLDSENGLNGDELAIISSFCLIERMENKELKKYEDLEEQGKLLKLPCVVGDTVYVVMTYSGYVEEIVITGFSVASNVIFMMRNEEIGYREDLFGKTVFLTRQEAEDKLAEMEGKK